ncbi:MAG: rhodanese-like domain-containing protein [Tissierellia bacterium]|nr:rhodanese-like domain-containing protein [Tissierellia bacterium]
MNKKRWFLLSLVLVFVLGLVACQGQDEGAYHMGEDLFVVQVDEGQTLLTVKEEGGTAPVPGNLYAFEVDQVALSYPGQAWVDKMEDLGPGSGYVINTDLAQEIKDLLRDQVQLVDVREPQEYEEGHLEGAINIPLGSLASLEAPKDGLVVVYCRSGRRSAQAVKELMDLGYTNVLDAGGIQ